MDYFCSILAILTTRFRNRFNYSKSKSHENVHSSELSSSIPQSNMQRNLLIEPQRLLLQLQLALRAQPYLHPIQPEHIPRVLLPITNGPPSISTTLLFHPPFYPSLLPPSTSPHPSNPLSSSLSIPPLPSPPQHQPIPSPTPQQCLTPTTTKGPSCSTHK